MFAIPLACYLFTDGTGAMLGSAIIGKVVLSVYSAFLYIPWIVNEFQLHNSNVSATVMYSVEFCSVCFYWHSSPIVRPVFHFEYCYC